MTVTKTLGSIHQPIAFDELVSKVIASGMTRRGWKKELKNYLDLQVRFRLPLLIGDTDEIDAVHCIERDLLYLASNIPLQTALSAVLECPVIGDILSYGSTYCYMMAYTSRPNIEHVLLVQSSTQHEKTTCHTQNAAGSKTKILSFDSRSDVRITVTHRHLIG